MVKTDTPKCEVRFPVSQRLYDYLTWLSNEAVLGRTENEEATIETFRAWRQRVGDKLREIAARHPPRLKVDLDGLADMIRVIFEGAFLMSKTYDDPATVGQQLRHYRNYLELPFGTDAAA